MSDYSELIKSACRAYYSGDSDSGSGGVTLPEILKQFAEEVEATVKRAGVVIEGTIIGIVADNFTLKSLIINPDDETVAAHLRPYDQKRGRVFISLIEGKR